MMDEAEKIRKAQELGSAAYHSGQPNLCAEDEDLLHLIVGTPGETSVKIAQAWKDGWVEAQGKERRWTEREEIKSIKRQFEIDTKMLDLIEKLLNRIDDLEDRVKTLENPSEYNLLMQAEATQRARRQ